MNAVISSRTPEGRPIRCSVCGLLTWIEPSEPLGDAPCPGCGCLHWFEPQPQFSIAPGDVASQVDLGAAFWFEPWPEPSIAPRELAEPGIIEVPDRPSWKAGLVRVVARLSERVRPARQPRRQPVASPSSSDLYDPWLDG